MNRLLIHVEGQTEERFVNEVLAPHLVTRGYQSVTARLFGNARLRRGRGGVRPWPAVRTDLVRHLKEDRAAKQSIMVDYYGMPTAGDGGWPERATAPLFPMTERAKRVGDAMHADLLTVVPDDAHRFVPYVAMHEFEALLFSDCAALGRAVGREAAVSDLQSIADSFATPEEINDSPETAPSKRLIDVIPGYDKVLFGTLAALQIRLDVIRAACPGFHAWLTQLEGEV